MALDGLTSESADGSLLSAIDELRASTRERRHAFWLPLLVFGIVICAAAPLYVWTYGPSSGEVLLRQLPPPRTPWLSALGGNDLALGRDSSAETRGWYWTFALLTGALTTGLWYPWYAQVAGVATRVRASVATWVLATLALVLASMTSLAVAIASWPMTFYATSALLVIAIGLIVLACIERSRLLSTITALFGVVVALCTFHDMAGLLDHLLLELGVPQGRVPYSIDDALVLVLPGLLLIVGAVIALGRDLRRR